MRREIAKGRTVNDGRCHLFGLCGSEEMRIAVTNWDGSNLCITIVPISVYRGKSGKEGMITYTSNKTFPSGSEM